MAKIIELMVSLLRDNVAKTCNWAKRWIEAVWRLAAIFLKRMILHVPVYIPFQVT
jgi:hypothetical protein